MKKGITNNPNGRPPGIPNQSTAETKEILNGILRKNFTPAKVQKDLNALTPDRRLEILTKLLQFSLPRPTELKLAAALDDDNPYASMVVEIIDKREQVDKSLL